MQSKMTEKEFRNELRRLYEIAAPEEVVVAMIKRAGLEFAPEPLPIPEELIFYNGELVPGSVVGRAGVLGTWAFPPEAHRAAALQLAAKRYRAYPGLRAAAERVLQEVRHCATQRDYAAAAAELEAELAKGPKP